MSESIFEIKRKRDKQFYEEEIVFWNNQSSDELSFLFKDQFCQKLARVLKSKNYLQDRNILLLIEFSEKLKKSSKINKIGEIAKAIDGTLYFISSHLHFIKEIKIEIHLNGIDLIYNFEKLINMSEIENKVVKSLKKQKILSGINGFKDVECYTNNSEEMKTLRVRYLQENDLRTFNEKNSREVTL